MKLFEASWRVGYEYFERYYDTQLNKSVKRKIPNLFEWYEEYPMGSYTAILDETIRLEKKTGNSKQARGNYGIINPVYRNIRDNYWGKNAYNMEPRIMYLDIETRVGTCSKGFPVPEKAAEPISLFQVFDSETKTMFVLGLREWTHKADYKFDFPVKYILCQDEVDLIDKFLLIFQRIDPLIIYAWNGEGFDFPYIHNRMKNLGMDVNRLSNYGDISYKESEFQGKMEFRFNSDGHYFLDLMKIYEKFVFAPRASYSLNSIAEIDLKEGKVNHTEYAGFDDFYTGKYIIPENPTEEQKNSKLYKEAKAGNWEEVRELSHSEFVYYGIKDTYLVERIDNHQNFTNLILMISEKMGVLFGDAMGTVKPWAQYITNRSYKNNQILPQSKDHNDPHVVGGYVRAPELGKHHWVLSADVNSMYPLLGMAGFNMSPETFMPKYKLPAELRDIVLTYFNNQEESERFDIPADIWKRTTELLKEHKLSLGVNGAVFKADKLGLIPELVLDIYATRKKAKQTQFKYEQRKILIHEMIKDKQNV